MEKINTDYKLEKFKVTFQDAQTVNKITLS